MSLTCLRGNYSCDVHPLKTFNWSGSDSVITCQKTRLLFSPLYLYNSSFRTRKNCMMTLLILYDLENIEVALHLILTLQFTQKLHQVNIFNLPTAVKGQCDVCWHSGHLMKATEQSCYASLTDFN